jgi:adenylate cyclase
VPERREALLAGRQAMSAMRRRLAGSLAKALERDPEMLATAVEMGVVRREWLEQPGEGEPITTATPMEVIHRYLESTVEQRPSFLAHLGLSTIQLLSSFGDNDDASGTPAVLTVAFTDLEGFTRYTATNGDGAASGLLADHHRAVGPIVRSRGGKVVKRLGDGLLLTFPAPEAGVLTCLELVDQQPEPLRLRAGMHTGEVVVTRDDVIGHVVNVAARVAEGARGGQVLVTVDVRSAVGELRGVEFGRVKRQGAKGVPEAIGVCEAGFFLSVTPRPSARCRVPPTPGGRSRSR